MGRPKKNKDLHSETKEVIMTEITQVDEVETVQQELDVVRLELEKAKKDLAELRANPKREYSDAENKIADKQINTIIKNDGLKEKIAKQKAYDSVKVTGRFMNRRNPGQTVKLPYVKYPEDPAVWHTFREGGTYTIPRGFADQINGGTDEDPCYYTPVFTQKTGQFNPSPELGENSQIAAVDTSNKRYAFVRVGFD